VSKGRPSRPRPSRPALYAGLAAALIGLGLFYENAARLGAASDGASADLQGALARERASEDVEQVARWAVASQDPAGLPFVIVDKARARLFAFSAAGQLIASAPVLLGTSRGDGPAVPAATPAGRFVAATWLPVRGDGIVWINADAAVWLYAIPSELSPGHSAQRLASDDVEDRRISDGSVHVAGRFFRDHLSALKAQPSIAYVLPEVLPVRAVFDSHSSGTHLGLAHLPKAEATARRPS
jgi:hypothetical protein